MRWNPRITTAAALAAPLCLGSVLVAQPAAAAPTDYRAVFVEPAGGPNGSPFSCDPGTSCGSANVSGFGHAADSVVTFGACGAACHVRELTFADGSTLVIEEREVTSWSSPGNAGSNGYIAFGLPGNPQTLSVTQTVVGGTGQFENATGSGTGTVRVHGGSAIVQSSGTIDLG